MEPELEPQQYAEPIDNATRATLDEAEAQIAHGEVYTLEEMRKGIQERSQAWRRAQQVPPPV